MPRWLAMAAYRCEIGGEATGSIDFRVLSFDYETEAEVHSAITSAATHSYQNEAGDLVSWPLAQVLSIEEYLPHESGDEVIGFIATQGEIREWCFGPADKGESA